jgi:succinate dehydrogenase/fumarate reductase flavoprotein subunit
VVADGVIDGDLAAGSGSGLVVAGEVEGVLIHGAHRVEALRYLPGPPGRPAGEGAAAGLSPLIS